MRETWPSQRTTSLRTDTDMPAVASGKVLVTGATGFVAGCIMQSLLQSGFSVRGTVRTESKGKALQEKLGEKFEFAIVEDMVKVRLRLTWGYFVLS